MAFFHIQRLLTAATSAGATILSKAAQPWKRCLSSLRTVSKIFPVNITVGRHPSNVGARTLILFPTRPHSFGLRPDGIAHYKGREPNDRPVNLEKLNAMVDQVEAGRFSSVIDEGRPLTGKNYLGGSSRIETLLKRVQALKCSGSFYQLFTRRELQKDLKRLSDRLRSIIDEESARFEIEMGNLDAEAVETASRHLETLRDINWSVTSELMGNIREIGDLSRTPTPTIPGSPFAFSRTSTRYSTVSIALKSGDGTRRASP